MFYELNVYYRKVGTLLLTFPSRPPWLRVRMTQQLA